jgi:hypothetical protein
MMKLSTGWAEILQAPNDEQIESILREAPGGINSFVILENDSKNFMQAHGDWESGFRLEHWENGEGYCCQPDPEVEVVIKTLQSYARGDDSWRTNLNWEKINKSGNDADTAQGKMGDSSIQGTEKKGKRPRYTKKGLLYLAAFAVFLPFFCIIAGTPLGIVFMVTPAIVAGVFLAIEIDRKKKNFAIPTTFNIILVNIILWSVLIGLIIFIVPLFPKRLSEVVVWLPTLGILGTLIFFWSRDLVYLIDLNQIGVEEEPKSISKEGFDTGEFGWQYHLVYRYADGQIGRSAIKGFDKKTHRLKIRYLPDHPQAHQVVSMLKRVKD